MKYLIINGKHHLIEKPLILNKRNFNELSYLSKKYKTVSYTAYNHRLNLICKFKKIINKKKLVKYILVICFMVMALTLVKESNWKDSKSGVLADLDLIF